MPANIPTMNATASTNSTEPTIHNRKSPRRQFIFQPPQSVAHPRYQFQRPRASTVGSPKWSPTIHPRRSIDELNMLRCSLEFAPMHIPSSDCPHDNSKAECDQATKTANSEHIGEAA